MSNDNVKSCKYRQAGLNYYTVPKARILLDITAHLHHSGVTEAQELGVRMAVGSERALLAPQLVSHLEDFLAG